MEIRQAVVAIGGKASRIRREGYPVAISKSFIPVRGRPLLYWNLVSLRRAGVTSVILCADQQIQLREAEMVLQQFGSPFRDVRFFSDPGLGVHGLPYQVICRRPGWLDEAFIFECGHSLMTPEHYVRLVAAKTPGNVVFSAFLPHPSNRRQPVKLATGQVVLLPFDEPGCHAIAHPIVADYGYAERLPSLGYDVRNIISYYGSQLRLRYVFSDMPPEFDVPAEMIAALPLYRDYIAASLYAPGPPAARNGGVRRRVTAPVVSGMFPQGRHSRRRSRFRREVGAAASA